MRLTVKQLKNREPGSGMAVIDREALSELGVSSGDFVAIEGRDGGRAIARVWPSDSADAGRGIVRIDGQLRQAANVNIDDRVAVERTEVKPADRVTVALPQNLRIRGDLAGTVNLGGRPSAELCPLPAVRPSLAGCTRPSIRPWTPGQQTAPWRTERASGASIRPRRRKHCNEGAERPSEARSEPRPVERREGFLVPSPLYHCLS